MQYPPNGHFEPSPSTSGRTAKKFGITERVRRALNKDAHRHSPPPVANGPRSPCEGKGPGAVPATDPGEGVGGTVEWVDQHRVYRPKERPDIEVLVDGVWCVGELRMWSQREDGSRQGDVQWRANGEPIRRLDTFTADLIRPGIAEPPTVSGPRAVRGQDDRNSPCSPLFDGSRGRFRARHTRSAPAKRSPPRTALPIRPRRTGRHIAG